MHYWRIDDALMMHWWIALMMHWWIHWLIHCDALINALTMHWWWKEELNEGNWCIWCNECIDDVLMVHWGCIDKCNNECIDDALMNDLMVYCKIHDALMMYWWTHWWIHWWCSDECIDGALMDALMKYLNSTVRERPVRLLILASLIVPAW